MNSILNRSKKAHAHKGFTLLEMVIVMILIAILIVVGFRGMKQQTARANATRVANDLKNFETAVTSVMMNNTGKCADGTLAIADLNKYMSNDSPITADGTSTVKGTLGLNDPWETAYNVEIVHGTKTTTVYVYTTGKDTTANTADDCVMIAEYKNGDTNAQVQMDTAYVNTLSIT